MVEATDYVLENCTTHLDKSAAVSMPYLRCFGVVVMGHMMLRSKKAAQEALDAAAYDPDFCYDKINNAHFYQNYILQTATLEAHRVMRSAEEILAAEF